MNKAIEKDAKTLYELGDELFMHPELGYKEFTNKKILTDYFEANGPKCSAVVGVSGGKDSSVVAALL